MLKARKKAKFDLNLRLDISQTTKARVSIFCVVLYFELSNILPLVNISGTITAMTSKFCVML